MEGITYERPQGNEDGLSTFQDKTWFVLLFKEKGIVYMREKETVPELGEFSLCLSVQVRSLGAAGAVFLREITRNVRKK